MAASLTGVRVVSLATNLPGPVAAARLATLGASVVKVEPPAGDALAVADPEWYRELAAGQQVRGIDLKSETGRAQVPELLAKTDVLLTASRPAALARLGLSWPDLSSEFPRLCQVAIVGHSGMEADNPGHDLTYQAEAGLLDGPTMPRVPYADLAGAERAVSEVCAALLNRALHGTTEYREVPLAEIASELAAPWRHGLTGPGSPLGDGDPAYGTYAAQEGYVAVACLERHFRRRLFKELGVDGTRASLERVFRKGTACAWEKWANDRDLPLVRIVS